MVYNSTVYIIPYSIRDYVDAVQGGGGEAAEQLFSYKIFWISTSITVTSWMCLIDSDD